MSCRYEVQPADLTETCLALRDDPDLKFEILIDLAGIDYLEYGRQRVEDALGDRVGFQPWRGPG